MSNRVLRNWLNRISRHRHKHPVARKQRGARPCLERLEDRTVPTVTLGSNFTALDFNQSGGYTPPDTCGAAGPTSSSTGLGAYVETVNQAVALYTNKTGPTQANPAQTSPLSTFWFTTGGLTHADSGSSLSDPIVAYNDQIGRFIIGDQDVNFTTHVSNFDLAVSKTSNPASLGTADWTFYQITTTETGYDADYPGNFGYNHDAFVFTLNMFNTVTGGANHCQVVSVNNADLAAGVAPSSLHVYHNDVNDFALRPTTMHDSVAGDPMWLITEHGDNHSIDVISDTNVLSDPQHGGGSTFTYTNLAVTPYSATVNPLNPNGTVITNNIDSRIDKAAEWNKTIVASHSVSVSSTEDDAQWYAVDVSGSTPVLKDQGRVSGGNHTYVIYPTIDVNSSGQFGLTYMKSGTDTSTDYLSMYLTGRNLSDAAGTMEAPVEVSAGTGQANYKDFSSGGRAGDLSGINVDPSNGSFWAANEFANTEATANWGTAVANFTISSPLPATDLAVAITAGPASPLDVSTGAQQVTYSIVVTNNGPSAAQGVVLSDVLPAGASFVSMSETGPDPFTLAQSGGTITESATAGIASGSSDTFTLVVTAPGSLANGAAFNDTASVQASNSDPNTSNNSAAWNTTIVNVNPNADLSVSVSGPATANEGATVTYTITVTNAGPSSASGATLTDTLGALLNYKSATLNGTAVTPTVANGVVTVSLGTIASGGKATVTITAQAIEDGSTSDSALVSSSSPDPNSANNSASATTSLAETSIVVSSSITTRSSSLTNYTVATFTHASGVEPAGAFVATIAWGDGTTSTGTITQSGTTYSVIGSHRYTSGGRHTIKTTVTESTQAVSKADVDPATLPLDQRDVVRYVPPRNGGQFHSPQTPTGHPGGSAAFPLPAGSTPQTSGWLLDLIAGDLRARDHLFSQGIDNLDLSSSWFQGSPFSVNPI